MEDRETATQTFADFYDAVYFLETEVLDQNSGVFSDVVDAGVRYVNSQWQVWVTTEDDE